MHIGGHAAKCRRGQLYPLLKRLFVLLLIPRQRGIAAAVVLSMRSQAPKVKAAEQSLGSSTEGPKGLCGKVWARISSALLADPVWSLATPSHAYSKGLYIGMCRHGARALSNIIGGMELAG